MDEDGDKIRRMIAERAMSRSSRSGYDSGGMEGWTDRSVASGEYYPTYRSGRMGIEVGGGALVRSMSPAEFVEMYGQVPPEFGRQWLDMQKNRK